MKRSMILLVLAGFTWMIGSSGCSRSTTSTLGLTPDLQEIAVLAQNHTSDENIIGYIRNTGKPYKVTANDIVILTKNGVSQNVIAVLMQPPAPSATAAVVPVASAAPATPVAAPVAPAPVIINVNNPAPTPATPVAAVAPSAPPLVTPVSIESEPPASPEYFEAQLRPYGEWVNLPEFGGRCWLPAGLPPDWRPYFDSGHWVYTDSGMCWASDYPWGAIPFHYGRWIFRGRWLWVPAYEYAPAWVLWRHGEGHMGWAPAPPGALFVGGGWQYHGRAVAVDFDFGLAPTVFVFIGGEHVLDRDFHRHELHGEEWHRAFARSEPNHFVRDEHGHGFRVEGLERAHIEHLVGHSVEPARHDEIRLHALESLHKTAGPQPRSEGPHKMNPAAPAEAHQHENLPKKTAPEPQTHAEPAEAHPHTSLPTKKTAPEPQAEAHELSTQKHVEPVSHNPDPESRPGHAGKKPAAVDPSAASDTTEKPAPAEPKSKRAEPVSRGGGKSATVDTAATPDNTGRTPAADSKRKRKDSDPAAGDQN